MRADPVLPRDFDQAGKLWDQAFPILQGSSYLDDFPVWDPSDTYLDRMILSVREGDRIKALAGVLFTDLMVLPNEKKRAALIGGVCTEPESRGKGLASFLIQELLEKSAEKKVDLALLWSGEHSMYEKLGFRLGGTQWRIPLLQLKEELRKHSQSKDSGLVKEGFADGIAKSMKRLFPFRSLETTEPSFLKKFKNVRWFWAQDPTTREFAYSALGRGMDLSHIVHEWGGTPTLLSLIWEKIAEIDPDASFFHHPLLKDHLPFPLPEWAQGYDEKLALIKGGETIEDRIWISGLEAV